MSCRTLLRPLARRERVAGHASNCEDVPHLTREGLGRAGDRSHGTAIPALSAAMRTGGGRGSACPCAIDVRSSGVAAHERFRVIDLLPSPASGAAG